MEATTVEVNKSLLECPDKPPYPTGNYTQKNVTAYIAAVEAWGFECKGDLGAVKKTLEDYEKEIKLFNRMEEQRIAKESHRLSGIL